MTLRKITVNDSVNCIAQIEETQSISSEGDIEPNRIKITSLPKKQNKKLSQINKTFIKEYITGEGFGILKRIMKCYF